MVSNSGAMQRLLHDLYGRSGNMAFQFITDAIERFKAISRPRGQCFSEQDQVLITYGDTLRGKGQSPLRTLHGFAADHLKDCFSAIHLLPFYPYSSDDGFSVMDYFQVDSALGTWRDIAACGADFDLMVDFVLNHISSRSPWFAGYLQELPGYADLAIEVAPDTDLSAVIRPRALPLLTPFSKATGKRVHLWTTFSADQIDLNYKSIDVLNKMVEVLLFYVARGGRLIRMDAVAYLWKEVGTRCIHLPQTHAMVRLFRMILDQVAPEVLIVTETNVPHEENIGYFGNGRDEAQLVYNFSLPPLLLHTFLVGDTGALSNWARGLRTPSNETAFLNFTASHDGIGVRPAEGILDESERQCLARMALDSGGRVSYKFNPDGSQSPYELNITYVDALGRPGCRGTSEHAARLLASQAIQLALPGVPAVYVHTLLGSRNWHDGVAATGQPRSINREKLDVDQVLGEFRDPGSFRSRIFFPYCRMLAVRRKQPAFHPTAAFKVLRLHPTVFAIQRAAHDQRIYALTHIGGHSVTFSLKNHGAGTYLRDLLTDRDVPGDAVTLSAYQTLWLERIG